MDNENKQSMIAQYGSDKLDLTQIILGIWESYYEYHFVDIEKQGDWKEVSRASRYRHKAVSMSLLLTFGRMLFYQKCSASSSALFCSFMILN